MGFEDLLLSENTAEQEKGNLLDRHNRRHPLNEMGYQQHADKLRVAADGRSERSRVWAAVRKLIDSGLRVRGPKGNVDPESDEWDVDLECHFDCYGYLKGVEGLHGTCRADIPDLADMVQQALQEEGLPAVITVVGDVVLSYSSLTFKSARTKYAVNWRILDQNGFPACAEAVRMLLKWMEVDSQAFADCDTVTRWVGLGLDPETSLKWIRSHPDLAHPYLARGWIEAGMTPEVAAAWADDALNLAYYDRAAPWIRAGFSASQAGKWISMGIRSPGQTKPWLDAGITDEQLELLAQDMDRAGAQHMEYLLTQSDIALETLIKIRRQIQRWSASTILSWMRAGFSAEQIRSWDETVPGITLKQAKQWVEMGMGPEQAAAWVRADERFSDPALVRPWAKAGISVAKAGEWARHGICHYAESVRWIEVDPRLSNPGRVLALTQAGLTPQSLKAAREFVISGT